MGSLNYENKFQTRLNQYLKSQYDNKKDYKPFINYIRGVSRKFGWTYAKNGLSQEDIIQECFLKLFSLKRGELKELIEAEITLKNKENQTQKKYPKAGTYIKNHLIDKIKHMALDPLWEALLLPEEEINDYTGESKPPFINNITKPPPKNDKNKLETCLSKRHKKLLKQNKKLDPATPYINTVMDSSRLFTSGHSIGKSIILNSGGGYISIGSNSFDNDVIDRMYLTEQSKIILKQLEGFKEGKFSQRLFFEELITGYHGFMRIRIDRDVKAQTKRRRFQARMLKIFLNTNINRIKRHGIRLLEVTDIQNANVNLQFLEELTIDKNSNKYKEAKQYWKAVIKSWEENKNKELI